MKEGYIFSWFNAGRNYGQTLQAYALQRVLRDMGYNVEHVCFGPNRYPSTFLIRKLKDIINLSKTQRIIQNKFDKFIRLNMKITKRLNSDDQVRRFISKKNVDFLICGSDQVWNPYNVHPFYFLSEVGEDSTKRIAYAVSTCDEKRKNKLLEYPAIKDWIRKIDFLYVRENSCKRILQDFFKINSDVVLDPTLLLSGEEWIDKLHLNKKTNNYILCYAFNLTSEQKNIILLRAGKLNCKIKYGNILDEKENGVQKEKWSPTDFLEAILNAEEVFTDSFHGTVFSILFHKNFYVFDNGENENSDPYYNIDRMNTLLQLIGLENRLLYKNDISTVENINYEVVDRILKDNRRECRSKLRRSLE